MAGATHKNDDSWLEEAELVREMMCVDSRTATDPAHAAITVVNKQADPLPLDGIHEFFVCHGSIYPERDRFCGGGHDIFRRFMAGWWERIFLIRFDGYQFLEDALSTTEGAVVNNWTPGATSGMAALICVTKFSADAKVGCR